MMITKYYLFISCVLFLLLPTKVLAHSSDQESNTGSVDSIGIAVSSILLLVFVGLILFNRAKRNQFDVKKKQDRMKIQSLAKQNKIYMTFIALSIVSALLFLTLGNQEVKDEEITFPHIHGLGFTSDGQALLVPAHIGLRVYQNGVWNVPEDLPQHDYMGFSMYKDGFYSSGHPTLDSDLQNPLGIIRSKDKGNTIEILDLHGEIDFHHMAVGYETEDIYVFNPQSNSKMDQPGFFYSTDQSDTWNKSAYNGLEGQPSMFTAHPTDPGVLAVGTDVGVFLSTDYGNHFEVLTNIEQVSALAFNFDNQLLIGSGTKLHRIDLESKDTTEQNIPELNNDPITFIQQNPVDKDELVFATDNVDIFISHDGGSNWEEIVDEGIAHSH